MTFKRTRVLPAISMGVGTAILAFLLIAVQALATQIDNPVGLLQYSSLPSGNNRTIVFEFTHSTYYAGHYGDINITVFAEDYHGDPAPSVSPSFERGNAQAATYFYSSPSPFALAENQTHYEELLALYKGTLDAIQLDAKKGGLALVLSALDTVYAALSRLVSTLNLVSDLKQIGYDYDGLNQAHAVLNPLHASMDPALWNDAQNLKAAIDQNHREYTQLLESIRYPTRATLSGTYSYDGNYYDVYSALQINGWRNAAYADINIVPEPASFVTITMALVFLCLCHAAFRPPARAG